MLLKWLHVQCPWIYQNRAPLPIFLHRVTYIPMPLWTFFGSKSGFFEMIVKIAKKKIHFYSVAHLSLSTLKYLQIQKKRIEKIQWNFYVVLTENCAPFKPKLFIVQWK